MHEIPPTQGEKSPLYYLAKRTAVRVFLNPLEARGVSAPGSKVRVPVVELLEAAL
jgi:hypothetical protein